MHSGGETLLAGDPAQQRRQLVALGGGEGGAQVAELSSFSLLLPAAAWLLPIARFPAFSWLMCAGALLPLSRRRAGAAGAAGAASDSARGI